MITIAMHEELRLYWRRKFYSAKIWKGVWFGLSLFPVIDDDENMSSLCSSHGWKEAGKRLIAVLAVSSRGNDKQFGETPLSQIESLQTNCNCQIAQFRTILLFYPGAKSWRKTFPLTGKTEKRSSRDWNCHAGPSFWHSTEDWHRPVMLVVACDMECV